MPDRNPTHGNITYKLCFTRRKRKYIEIIDDIKIKRQTILDSHGPGPIANVCQFPDPPSFSLQTPFNVVCKKNILFLCRLLQF
jgi:hypothetical protein